MRESRTIEPALCTKALSALLDVLQGQLPEGLKSEPDDVIGNIQKSTFTHTNLLLHYELYSFMNFILNFFS